MQALELQPKLRLKFSKPRTPLTSSTPPACSRTSNGHVLHIEQPVQQSEDILQLLQLVLTPVSCASRHRAFSPWSSPQSTCVCSPARRSESLRRQAVVLLAALMNCLCRGLQKPLGFSDFFHVILHQRKLPVEFLVHFVVAVHLLKSRVHNRQRLQGPLRLPVQIQKLCRSPPSDSCKSFSRLPFFPSRIFWSSHKCSRLMLSLLVVSPTGEAETDLLLLLLSRTLATSTLCAGTCTARQLLGPLNFLSAPLFVDCHCPSTTRE